LIEGFVKQNGLPPRIAKIRLGVKGKTQAGKEYPKDTDHFVLADCPEVAVRYGDRPKALVVMFASDQIEYNFPQRLEAWSGKPPTDGQPSKSTLFCSSDGVTAHRIYKPEKDPSGKAYVQSLDADDQPEEGEMFEMPCPYHDCPYFEGRGCKEVGRLNVVLPEITLSGTYQVETSSAYGASNIFQMIDSRLDETGEPRGWAMRMTRSERHPGGHIAWTVPFVLERVPQTVVFEGKGTIKHILRLRALDDAEKLRNLQISVPAWMSGRTVFASYGPPQIDRPEDLFPGVATDQVPAIEAPAAQRALPPALEATSQQTSTAPAAASGRETAPKPAAAVVPDAIVEWAKKAGVTAAQLENLKISMRGDEDRIVAELKARVARKADKRAASPAPPQPAAQRPAAPPPTAPSPARTQQGSPEPPESGPGDQTILDF